MEINQCNDPEEKELLLDQLVTLNRTPQRILSNDSFSYYKEWYHSVVKAILEVVDFKDNYADLAKRLLPPITTRQARASIKLLTDLGLVRKNNRGFYKPTDKVVSTGTFAKEDIIHRFQVKCFDAARFAIVNSDKQPKRILTKTISISEAGYNELFMGKSFKCNEVSGAGFKKGGFFEYCFRLSSDKYFAAITKARDELLLFKGTGENQ